MIDQYSAEECFKKLKKKGFFGIFIKIIKIYSTIQTTDNEIRNAISEKKETWNKIHKYLIKPYENIVKEELGTLNNVPIPQ